MAWKPEYEENRKKREEANPELREKRLLSAKASQERNREFRIGYMKDYREKNPDKWLITEDKKKKKNEARRKRYAQDKVHREEMKRQSREWQANNPDKRLNQRMKKFGITGDDYHRILKEQNGKCAICGSADCGDIRGHRFHVDHCHETNIVRGLLCSNCNTGLGKFKDNVVFLQSAINYLRRN